MPPIRTGKKCNLIAKETFQGLTNLLGEMVIKTKLDKGNHSVKLGAYAAGLYYYSLNVDGNVATKKMIVE